MDTLPLKLIGDEIMVPCADGRQRPYLSLDSAASTSALPSVAARVAESIPYYSSVHRGAGYKSQFSTRAYEDARVAALEFAGRTSESDIAIICRNTTEAINHLAFRLGLSSDDTIITTVVEHHANLLPWRRFAKCRYVECTRSGIFGVDDVVGVLDSTPSAKLLAITGASNITGWSPNLDDIIEAAHDRGVRVLVDAAQLAPHRPMPPTADFVAWSGHKMYAPYGAGILIGPRETFADGEPFLAGGGAVDLVDLDEVLWTAPPEREEAGSPNVIGAIALHAAIDQFNEIGWEQIIQHDRVISQAMYEGLRAIPGIQVLGPDRSENLELLAVATFVVDQMHHGLVAARLSAEYGIGIRHGCFCAHPYLVRLLGLSEAQIMEYRSQVQMGDRSNMPGALRVSGGLSTTLDDVNRFLEALGAIISGGPPPICYEQEQLSGEFYPDSNEVPWYASRGTFPACGRS